MRRDTLASSIGGSRRGAEGNARTIPSSSAYLSLSSGSVQADLSSRAHLIAAAEVVNVRLVSFLQSVREAVGMTQDDCLAGRGEENGGFFALNRFVEEKRKENDTIGGVDVFNKGVFTGDIFFVSGFPEKVKDPHVIIKYDHSHLTCFA